MLTERERRLIHIALEILISNSDLADEILQETGQPVIDDEKEIFNLCRKLTGATTYETLPIGPHLSQWGIEKEPNYPWCDPVWWYNAGQVHRALVEIFQLAHKAGIMIEYRKVVNGKVEECLELSVDGSTAGQKPRDGAWCYACPDTDREPKVIL